MRVLQEGRARGGTFHHLRVTLWNTQSRQHFPLKTTPPDLSDSINWHFQLISHTQRHAANGADSSGALTHLVICAPMECDIRNRIWAAWHLLHFQLNQSQRLQVLWLACQSSSLRALVTPLLWADPWHISASSMETAAGNCLQPGEMGHGQKQECTVRGCNTRKKTPTFYPLSSCLFIAKSETQSSIHLKAYLHFLERMLLVNTNLFLPKKNHTVKGNTPWIQALCIWEARGSALL